MDTEGTCRPDGCPVQTISMIVNGAQGDYGRDRIAVPQDVFGASAGMWMGLEADWQLYKEVCYSWIPTASKQCGHCV